MTQGSLWDKILRFAIPLALTGILQQLFNAADTAIVGRFTGDMGINSMAAVGANAPITSLAVNLFTGIALGGNIVETAELMRVNQSELSANLEMLRAGLETILEKLSGDTAEREEEESFVEHLNQSLEAFHERASEVLMENAVKTQEILLEVLEQTQRSSAAPAAPAEQPKVEG